MTTLRAEGLAAVQAQQGQDPVRPEDTPDALALYTRIAGAPDDPFPRLVLADWLEGRAGTEACPHCRHDLKHGAILDPRQYVDYNPRTNVMEYDPPADGVCRTCSGAGNVPDRTARLAAGYRALGEHGRRALKIQSGRCAWFDGESMDHDGKPVDLESDLSDGWYKELRGFTRMNKVRHDAPPTARFYAAYPTRRAAEDAAALAWCAMTDAEREACDRELRGEVVT